MAGLRSPSPFYGLGISFREKQNLSAEADTMIKE